MKSKNIEQQILDWLARPGYRPLKQHELAHALVARRFGATVTISLNFLVGWASYGSDKPLTRRQRNLMAVSTGQE